MAAQNLNVNQIAIAFRACILYLPLDETNSVGITAYKRPEKTAAYGIHEPSISDIIFITFSY